MEDTVIINLYFDRSEKAIQATEEKYSRYCFSIAWNILYDKEDSDECVNDTWLATWNSIPPRKPAILSAFLGKITRNLAIDCFRSISEISARHGISESRIKSSLYRSRKKLWERVKHLYGKRI